MKISTPFTKPLQELDLAITAATNAGRIIMELYDKDLDRRFKSGHEPVSEADIESDKLIHEIISPTGYSILSEESIENKVCNDKIFWIVDPLDGTQDFLNKTGEFTVMLALVQDNKPILGVIYWPPQDALYVAQNAGGAFQFVKAKWSKLSVNKKTTLDQCNAVVSRHHLSKEEKDFLNYLKINCHTSRGSSLKVIDVCAGNAELYFTTTNKIKQWDTCASYSLIKEAGGKITDMFGRELVYNSSVNHQNGILVTNGLIHNKIIEKYNIFSKNK